MNNENTTAPAPPAVLPSSNTDVQQQWRGLTIDELKMRRAKALVMREVSRTSLSYQFNNARDNVSQNGLRGLLFSENTVAGLKKADYLLLGFKAASAIVKLYLRRKR